MCGRAGGSGGAGGCGGSGGAGGTEGTSYDPTMLDPFGQKKKSATTPDLTGTPSPQDIK